MQFIEPCTDTENLGKAESTLEYSFNFGRLGNLTVVSVQVVDSFSPSLAFWSWLLSAQRSASACASSLLYSLFPCPVTTPSRRLLSTFSLPYASVSQGAIPP